MKTPDTKVTTKITVSIKGQSFEMTVAEAKKLKEQLEAAIPEKPHPIFVPQPYPVPEPAPYRRRPWNDGPWLGEPMKITCSEQDRQNRFNAQLALSQ